VSTRALLKELYDVLRQAFSHRQWWPAPTPFEVMVGAILTQNTNWTNVEKAMAALKGADALTAPVLAQMDVERLQGLVRPAGYFRQKAARLKRLAAWVVDRGGGDPAGLSAVPTAQLREELLALNGIGPETADSILLYALGRPAFVVDTYTKRVAARHRLVDWECDYDELEGLFESNMAEDVELYKDFHAQLVELGKRFCRRRGPLCADCPARPVLGEPVLEEGA
jgi:endonuclease-3 related protein